MCRIIYCFYCFFIIFLLEKLKEKCGCLVVGHLHKLPLAKNFSDGPPLDFGI